MKKEKMEELSERFKEISELLNEKLKNGEISKNMFDELMTLDPLKLDFENNIEELKYYINKKWPIRSSEIMHKIYEEHKSGFRKALLISNCIPDPLNPKYNKDTHEFICEVINRTYTINKEAEKEFLNELKEIYFTINALYYNNTSNSRLLFKSDFSKYILSEQIRMCLIMLQDQSRIMTKKLTEKRKKNAFLTGMEIVVSDQKATDNPNVKMSHLDNYEGLVESLDMLFRYLYYSKGKELKLEYAPKHGDIHYFDEKSIQLVVNLATLRNVYVETWEKFKYSNWKSSIAKEKGKNIYVFQPRDKESYRRKLIAQLRRNYIQIKSNLDSVTEATRKESEKDIEKIKSKIDIDNFKTVLDWGIEEYSLLKIYYNVYLKQYDVDNFMIYEKFSFDDLTIKDISNVSTYLRIVSELYKKSLDEIFNENDYSTYKYIVPILEVNIMIQHFSKLYDIDFENAKKIFSCLLFDNTVNGSTDLFCRPLVKLSKNEIAFCPSLIEQMNTERIIEKLLKNNSVNIASIGDAFEFKIRQVLDIFSNVEVNTSKVEFKAFDGRDVEFDFIGLFDDYLLLWEFKATTSSYTDIELFDSFKSIKYGIKQIERRSKVIKEDWDKIRELANIELPEDPITEDKIIKIVGTNVLDYTGFKKNDIRIFDESTLLKFFVNPEVDAISIPDR
jgi:hypothetical protein